MLSYNALHQVSGLGATRSLRSSRTYGFRIADRPLWRSGLR